MHYDLGYVDLEQKTLQPLDNPFGPRLLPMSRAGTNRHRGVRYASPPSRWRASEGTLHSASYGRAMQGGGESVRRTTSGNRPISELIHHRILQSGNPTFGKAPPACQGGLWA